MKNCKHCGAELDEEQLRCPVCGAEQTEEPAETEPEQAAAPAETAEQAESTEAAGVEPVETAGSEEAAAEPAGKKPAEKRNVVYGIVVAVLIVIAVVCAVLDLGDSGPGDKTQREAVVATCGDETLDNQLLSYFYWEELYNLYSSYGSYLTYLVDMSQPLSEQTCYFDQTMSWQDYLVQGAVQTWSDCVQFSDAADAAGFEIPEQYRQSIEAVDDNLKLYAAQGGYDSVDAYLQASYGGFADRKSFKAYTELYLKAMSYANSLYETVEYTDQQIIDYFDENEEYFVTNYNVSKQDPNMVNVRHILIRPETESSEDLAAARTQAEELLAQWKDGAADEESFAQLAEAHSEDPGSNTNGGLYEEVYPGQMADSFNDWCFAAGRQVGDTGIVETTHGYHVLYFSGTCGNAYWHKLAEEELHYSLYEDLLTELTAQAEQTSNPENAVILELPEAEAPAEQQPEAQPEQPEAEIEEPAE